MILLSRTKDMRRTQRKTLISIRLILVRHNFWLWFYLYEDSAEHDESDKLGFQQSGSILAAYLSIFAINGLYVKPRAVLIRNYLHIDA